MEGQAERTVTGMAQTPRSLWTVPDAAGFKTRHLP